MKSAGKFKSNKVTLLFVKLPSLLGRFFEEEQTMSSESLDPEAFSGLDVSPVTKNISIRFIGSITIEYDSHKRVISYRLYHYYPKVWRNSTKHETQPLVQSLSNCKARCCGYQTGENRASHSQCTRTSSCRGYPPQQTS